MDTDNTDEDNDDDGGVGKEATKCGQNWAFVDHLFLVGCKNVQGIARQDKNQ